MSNNKIIEIYGFRGGIADSLYDDLKNQTYQSAQDLAVYDDTAILTPVYPAFVSITPPTTIGSLMIPRNFIKASDGKYYFLCTEVITATQNISLYHTPSLSASPSWTQDAIFAPSGNTIFGIDEYKDGLFFGNQNRLKRWGDLSGSLSATTAGSLTTTADTFGDIMTHKALGRIYFVSGGSTMNKVGWYDGSTFTDVALNLGVGLQITNLDQAGNFVLIGVRPVGNSKKSYVLVWNGSAATVEDIIEVGDIGLQGVRNHGGIIEMITSSIPSSATQYIQRIYKSALGGVSQLEREIKGINSTSVNPNAINVTGNGLYIGFQNSNIFSLNSKDKRTPEFLSDLRSLSPTAQAAGNVVIKSIRDTGAEIVVTWTDLTTGTVEKISATSSTQAYPSTGVFESNVFPLDGGLPGKIKRIVINHKGIPASCGFTVQIKQIGNYPWGTTVPSLDSYQDLVTPEGSGGSTGKTQSTDNACITEISGNELFKETRFVQIKIKYDEVTSTGAPSIVFPIIIEPV